MLLFLIMFPTWPEQTHNQYTVLTKTEIRLYLDGFCVLCLKKPIQKKVTSEWILISKLFLLWAVPSYIENLTATLKRWRLLTDVQVCKTRPKLNVTVIWVTGMRSKYKLFCQRIFTVLASILVYSEVKIWPHLPKNNPYRASKPL